MTGSSENAPEPGSRWQHYKGGTYTVVAVAAVADGPAEGNLVVVYRGEDGRVWARSRYGFTETLTDGTPRFQPL